MRIMGVDFGDTRIGISISDESEFLASPVGFITERHFLKAASAISEKAKELNAGKIVLGFPKNLNETEGTRAKLTRELKEKLCELTGLEVELFDERLTTALADSIMNTTNTKKNKKKKIVDTLSACIILQNYLDCH